MSVRSSVFITQFEGESHGNELGIAAPHELRARRVAGAPEPPPRCGSSGPYRSRGVPLEYALAFLSSAVEEVPRLRRQGAHAPAQRWRKSHCSDYRVNANAHSTVGKE